MVHGCYDTRCVVLAALFSWLLWFPLVWSDRTGGWSPPRDLEGKRLHPIASVSVPEPYFPPWGCKHERPVIELVTRP